MDLRAAIHRMPVDRALDAEMASHHALITYNRVLELGGSAALAFDRVHTKAWLSPYRGVYRDAAAPQTPEQDLLAAVMASGELAVASHRSAAWLWGLFAGPPYEP